MLVMLTFNFKHTIFIEFSKEIIVLKMYSLVVFSICEMIIQSWKNKR